MRIPFGFVFHFPSTIFISYSVNLWVVNLADTFLSHPPLDNCLIGLSHQSDGFLQSDHYSLIMRDVVTVKDAAFAILQPPLADLKPTDL